MAVRQLGALVAFTPEQIADGMLEAGPGRLWGMVSQPDDLWTGLPMLDPSKITLAIEHLDGGTVTVARLTVADVADKPLEFQGLAKLAPEDESEDRQHYDLGVVIAVSRAFQSAADYYADFARQVGRAVHGQGFTVPGERKD